MHQVAIEYDNIDNTNSKSFWICFDRYLMKFVLKLSVMFIECDAPVMTFWPPPGTIAGQETKTDAGKLSIP